MKRVFRRREILENHGAMAILYGLAGLVALSLGILLYRYRGQGHLVGLAWVLNLTGAVGIGMAIRELFQIKKVTFYPLECPFCKFTNKLTEKPMDDIACENCNRMIPLLDGEILPVDQVRCGFCNALNYYSPKTEVLICESCNHEIPITTEEGKPTKVLPKGFVIQEDENLYELVLVDAGPKTEEIIPVLQQMLAMNRNQVKDLMQDLPASILRGIPKMKAEMLQAQLSIHDAKAEYHIVNQ